MRVSVTRRYRFSASHRLHANSLSDEKNQELYGKCNNPYGHGHDYVLDVTYSGEVDRETGLVAVTDEIDGLIEAKIVRRFAGKNINLDIPEFSGRVPTTENVAIAIADILVESWPSNIRASLTRVHVQETDRNGFEIRLPLNSPQKASSEREHLVHA